LLAALVGFSISDAGDLNSDLPGVFPAEQAAELSSG
jgi:hypothetical protein